MRKMLVALVFATLCLGVPVFGEAVKGATVPMGTTTSTVAPVLGQIRVQVGRDRRNRRWDWRRYDNRRYDNRRYEYRRYEDRRFYRYPRYRRW